MRMKGDPRKAHFFGIRVVKETQRGKRRVNEKKIKKRRKTG